MTARMFGTKISSCEVEEAAWPRHGVVSCDLEDIPLPPLTWAGLCWSNLAQFSRNTALVDGLSGRSYSLGEARELAGRVGSGLLRYYVK